MLASELAEAEAVRLASAVLDGDVRALPDGESAALPLAALLDV